MTERKTHKERADSEGTFGTWQLCGCVRVRACVCACACESEAENKDSYMPGARDSHLTQRDGHDPGKTHK